MWKACPLVLGGQSILRHTARKGWHDVRRTYASAASTSSSYKPLPQGWEAVIGVEVHAQLKTNVKLFSNAPSPDDRRASQSPENSCVAPFDAALPGTLPALQKDAVQLALRACLALDCTVSEMITFDRKHYFYPDLPNGYQISQKYSPLAKNGKLLLTPDDGPAGVQEALDVSIEQIQLEQDTAKSSYRFTESHGGVVTIDLNRANAPLIEIVSGPDMRTPEQAGAYIRKLRETLRRIGASDGNMDEGSLRCDVNVSVHRTNEPWGVRCEIKNINSIKFAMSAIVYEMHRQQKLLQDGQAVEQETRAFNEQDSTTHRLRSKEDAPDYRYMPDPNLPPLYIDQKLLQEVRRSLPELVDAQRDRLIKRYGIGVREVNVLMRIAIDEDHSAPPPEQTQAKNNTTLSNGDAVAYFEELASGRDAQMALNWLIHDLLKVLNANEKTFSQNPLSAQQFGQLLDLVQQGSVTKSTAKELLSELVGTECAALFDNGGDAQSVKALLESRNALALDSGDALAEVCSKVMQDLPDAVAAVQSGNAKVLQRLIGEVMRRTKGRANAKAAGEFLMQQINACPTSSS